jgi:hypothetical protein
MTKKKDNNIIGSFPPLGPPETIVIDGVEVQMVRLPFVYYNPKSLSEFYRGERKLIGGGTDRDKADVYFTREYETPRKGFKLHPALRQSLKRGEKHKPIYLHAWDALDDRK